MKLYVTCVILLCFPAAFALLSSKVNDILYNYQDDCTKESGADASIVESARKAHEIPNDGRLDSFATCMLKKFNILLKDYSVNQDVHSYKIFTDNMKIYEVSDRCKTESGKNVGETARKVMNCFIEAGEILMPLIPRRN